jgi:hypothetical protein
MRKSIAQNRVINDEFIFCVHIEECVNILEAIPCYNKCTNLWSSIISQNGARGRSGGFPFSAPVKILLGSYQTAFLL